MPSIKPEEFGRLKIVAIKKHTSSVATFFGIYLIVTVILGVAVLALRHSHQKALDQSESLVASENRTIPDRVEKTPAPPAGEVAEPESKPEIPKPVETSQTQSPPPDPEPQPELPSPEEALRLEIEEMFPMPEVQPLLEIVGNWQSVPQRAFPSFVTIRKPVDFDIRQGGQIVGAGRLPAGSSMIPIRLQGDNLHLSSSRITDMSVSLKVSETDFREKIEARYQAFVDQQKREVEARRQAELKRRLAVQGHEVAMMEYNNGEDSRFDPVKASIRRGEAGFFKVESAARWRWGEEETHDGETFQIAFVVMVEENVFGVTERELKALLRDGSVYTWIDMTTGQPM